MNRFWRLAVLVATALLLLACSGSNRQSQATALPAGGEDLPVAETPADTRMPIPDTGDPQVILPRSGFLEVHFFSPFDDDAVCVMGYPFMVFQEQSRILLQGESGPFRCFFEHETCDSDGCITMNIFWALDTRLEGQVLTTAAGEPSGSAQLGWLIDGLVLIYYSGEHQSEYTRDNPLEVPRQEMIAMNLDYVNDASTLIELPKTALETDLGNDPYRLNFVLHLE